MSKQRTHGGIRRLVSGLLCLALMLGLLPAGLTLPAQAHWADPYGQKLVEWGVMRGDISGNLNLAKPITRAELVTMINRAYGYTRKAGVPFTDVPSSKWYADDIDIAYNAGYFKGVSSNRAAPESNVTREQAAVFLARNLMLQETVGETLGFSDTRTLSEWSRGLIGAAVKEGVLNGYADGSFKPQSNITRGELAAMLVRAIGTPVDKAGDHTLGHVYGNVTLNTSNVNLRNTTIYGNLYLTGGIDLGHVLLENVTVLGRIVISGAGEAIEGQESIVLRNVEAEEMVVDSLRTHTVTIRVQGVTDIPLTTVRANSFINDASWDGYGLARIELRGEPGRKFQLAGSIKEVVNYTPASDLQFVKGSAEKVTVDEEAIASNVLVDKNTRLDQLNLDVGTTVTGQGDIKNLNVGSSGSVVEQLPDQIVIRPGIDADIDGTVMGNSDAAELSAEPRLNAGYPYMKNVSPNQADGVFSGSKPGTIYWAISAVADGSVSEEDLIENPAYGGNIFQEQAGAINTTSANTEYISKVEQLEPDGSYYVSAILVDGRGKRSPLKVAAFTTPDDTKPAFVKDPTLTKNTTDTTQATVMANKSCLLYWALLPTGAQAPTPQEFKTGSLGGNYGYGSLSLMKNAEISVTVNRQKLREKTTYDLFLWLTDHNGAQSMDAPFKITFTTPDETPPVVTAPTQVPPYGADFANVQFSMNEAPATLFWAVVPEGDTTFIVPGDTPEETAEIMSDLRTKIKVEGAGDSVTSSGNTPVATAYANIAFQISKLDTAKTGTNSYTMYYVGKDAAGNYSDRVQSITIKTLDTTPPEVEQQFTEAVEGRPRASSSIKLVFSETVKGGAKEGGKTFLDFYQDVLDATDDTTRKAARDNLAAELAAHIKMYYVPRSGQPQLLEPKGDNYTGDNSDWVIDFHNAQVTLENGKMIITLPNNETPDDSALQLDSGATYYFQLLGVYDNAFQPNGLADDPNGNYKLDNFTTIYGQVELAQNTSLTKIPDTDADFPGIRLDMCVEVKPESTSKMPDTEYWDMVIWSNIGVDVRIYWQKDNDPWQLLNGTAEIPIEPAGIGLGTRRELSNNASKLLNPVNSTLEEGHTYRYGIHITRVGNIKETSETEEPQDWSELVTLRFSLVAGTSGDITNLSRNVSQNYDNFVNKENRATEIGIEYLQTGTRRILEYPKQFNDTRVPDFSSDMPQFEAGSGTIVMKAGLARPGRVYWVAAPVGTIVTGVEAGKPINSTNDGSNGTINSPFYIPTSGTDREAKKNSIHFMAGSTLSDGTTTKEYASPYYRDITNGKEVFANYPDVKTGVEELSVAVSDIEIKGLKPKTWYYIYIVREGGGDPSHIVEIYRVQTTEVKVPSIVVNGTNTTATMTPSEDCELSFALVEYNSLPDYIRNATGGAATVLQQMMERQTGTSGPSKFDVTGSEDVKKKVAEYVLGTAGGMGEGYAGSWTLPDGDKYKDPISAGQQVTWNFEEQMTSPKSEYVLLVIARHQYGGTGGADYGFSAIRALYTPDKVPPEFQGTDKESNFLVAAVNPDGVTPGDQSWKNHPEDYTYSGSVGISFSKDIFYLEGGVRYTIVYGTAGSGQKKLGDLLGGTAIQLGTATVKATTGTVGASFVLELDKIRPYQQIIIFSGGEVSNGSSYTMKYRLTLTFDPTLTQYDYGNAVSPNGARFLPGYRLTMCEFSPPGAGGSAARSPQHKPRKGVPIMKRNSLRRLGALVLSLALTLSLAPPAWAADPSIEINPTTLTLAPGGTSANVTATLKDGGSPAVTTYAWSAPTDSGITFGSANSATTTVTAGSTKGTYAVTVKATWTDDAGGSQEVSGTLLVEVKDPTTPDPGPTTPPTTAPPPPRPPVTITPPKKTTFGLGESVTLTTVAANVPAGANVAYQWTANGLTVKPVGNGSSCTLTGNTAGSFTVKVTMTVEETDGTMKTYEDTITLSWEEKAVSGLSFSGGDTALVKGRDDPNPWDLTVNVIPAGADPGENIQWEIRSKDLSQDASEVLALPKQSGSPDDPDAPSGPYTGGKTVKLTSVGPGEVTVTARYGNYEAHKDVIVSGIVLNASETSMQVGETVVLAVEKMFGFASSGAAYDVAWSSSDPSTVTVINGELQAWKLGSAVITANKNGYTATCRVVVKEDEEAVISGISATTSEPLTFDTLYQKLSEISIKKTQVLDANENVLEPGSPLHYITNVKVPTEQGTLYYNYDSESNTGAGVGSTDRFAYQRTASIQQTLDKLYFVPKQGYNGVAEITLVGWAENGSSFSITVKVDVAGSQGIRYKTTSGKPAYFLGSDFNAYCRVRTGRDLSYVTFNLPQSSQGGLYYGYTSAGQYAGRVSTSTQYARTGRYTIDDVCFVPTDAFVGETRISYRCVDTSGNAFTGEVIINVTPSGAMGETATVRQTGQWGEPVRLRPELFNAACQSTIGDTLAYVRFQLPAYDKGALYYNYQGGSGSRVDSSSRYYYSGSPGLGSVTFVPASNGADQVAVPYTGYGEGGTSYTGTLYITLGEEDRTTVRYSIAKEETVSFQFNDFNEAALLQMGTSLEYIEFRFPEELSFGTLYYDYRGEDYNYPAAPDTPYYREPKEHWQQRLDRISFHAGTTAGSANIPFTAYSAEDKAGNRKSFQGTLVLQVGAASPADITLSGYTSGQFWLSAYEIGRVCAPVMNQGLSYIQITGLPDPEEGVVYYGYQGFKTGSEVKRGDRYYCMGAPNIDQVSFIPRGGFSGRAEITYIGYSTDGKEQVSGKIVLNVSQRSTTQLYNDMGRHGWAVDAVEFLSRNGTVNGVGGGRFNPTGPITKGDFVLMLVRAFGFKADGTVTYSDVPAGSYYAQAISIATQKGIASGWNGRFDPKWVLTRQEAMLMIYKALKADGHPLNNGLTADLDAFRDSKDIEPSARTAVGALILLGVVQGNGDGTLRPRATLSRAETASLMHRLMTMPGSAG